MEHPVVIENFIFIQSGQDVFYHSFDASPQSNSCPTLYARFIAHYSRLLGTENVKIELNYDTEDASTAVNQIIDKLAVSEMKKVIILDDFQLDVELNINLY
jgi:hypothetical protein